MITIWFHVGYSQDTNLSNVVFYNLNKEYGISIRESNQVCADDYGFIWISSKMGIVRYSQGDIRKYRLPYESSDIITVHLTFKDGNLYAYTNNGQIFMYNYIMDQFDLIFNLSKSINNPYMIVYSVIKDDSDNLWIASTSGLFCFNQDEGVKNYLPDKRIHHLCWKENSRFFYTTKDGIYIWDVNNLQSELYVEYPLESDVMVSSLYFDNSRRRLWVGTMVNGLYVSKYIDNNVILEKCSDIPNQPILALESISENILLLGIDGQGVWNINKEDYTINDVYKEDSDNPKSLKGNGVYDVFLGPNDRVWICTYSGGVSFFDIANPVLKNIEHVINNANSLVNNDVNGVLEDSDGNLWFATNNGISKWNIKQNKWQSFYHNKQEHAQVFLSLYEDNEGRIWAGSYSSGVYLLERNTGKQLAHYCNEFNGDEFDNDFVFDIIEDANGDIWIGGVRGSLICFKKDETKFKSFKYMTVNVLIDYEPDNLLVGTTYGLLLFNKKTGDYETLVDGYLIYDIYRHKDKIWMASSGNGLIIYDTSDKSVKVINEDSGLPSNFVTSVCFSNGYFWIGTEQGLCRISEDGQLVQSFRSNINLNHVSFNQNAHYKLANGQIIYGTNRGALIFSPSLLNPAKEKGKIFFQDLNIAGNSIREIESFKLTRPIDSLNNLNLKYYQNNISLELLPIGVSSAEFKYSWILEGLDSQWSNPGDNRILSYSNIPSDSYTLRIRMYDDSATEIIAERKLDIRIVPPFWERWWFKLSIFLFLLGLGVFFFVYYVDRLRKQHSEEKIRFFANTAHDIRTSLTLINGPIEELNKEQGLSGNGLKYLHLATEQTQRLSNAVTQLMDFQKVDIGKERLNYTMVNIVKFVQDRVMMFESYAKRKNLEIVFRSSEEKYETAVDEIIIEKIIDNLLSNAIKYSYENSKIDVSIRFLQNKWILDVQDYGIGIDKKAQKHLFREYYRGENAANSKIVGSGIGLLLVKSYVALLGGKISCQSQYEKGSLFQVSIPVKDSIDAEVSKEIVTLPIEYSLSSIDSNDRQELQVESKSKNKLKVLIVEDHDYLRDFLKTALNDYYQIFQANNGEEAWNIIEKHSPDLVVSDIMMPKMNGFELCSKIKSTNETSHIAVILLTSLADKAQQLQGLGLGADDYLTKPFDVTLLQQRIKSIIQNREVIREKALKIIRHDKNEEPIFDNELNDSFLKGVVDVVRANISNSEFSKDDFASAMNVSPSLLYKKVKALTNQSPTDFIKSIRLEKSLELINSRKYTVTEISEMCGFSSVGYFSTVFRKHYGKSPTQVSE